MSRDIMHYAKTFKGVIENDFCQQVISELQDAVSIANKRGLTIKEIFN